MTIDPGARLGSYEITGQLGAGGMGEVYRARDTKLERDVAIKVLPGDFADDPERLARFEREAKALAALNHPNIATVHGFEQDGPTHFLIMELADGQDLAERLKAGPIPIDDAIPLFAQIAEGLEAAHEKGIVHRDLKPANIIVSPEGRAKILDFGLAKALEPAATDADLSHSPTMTAATLHGVILGTAAYMSPEQASGKPVDKRTDIWAFGVCLYEALVGARLFQADDAPNTLAGVLRDEIDLSSLPPDFPANVRRVLERCLVRDPRHRLHDVADARIELEQKAELVAPLEVTRPAARRSLWPMLLTVGLLALLVGLVGGRFLTGGGDTHERRVTRLPIALPRGVELAPSHKPRVTIDRQGRRIAYVGRTSDEERIYIQDLSTGALAWSPPETVGALSPFFSADGNWLGFVAAGYLEELPIAGGEARRINDVAGLHNGTWWTGTGSLLFAPSFQSGLWRTTPDQRVTEEVTRAIGEEGHFYPQGLPDGRILLSISNPPPRVAVASVGGEEHAVLVEDAFHGRYLPSGHLVYARRDTLFAAPFDLATDRLGDEVAVIRDLVTSREEGFGEYEVSLEGTLVYWSGASERERQLVHLRPGVDPEPLTERPEPFTLGLALSPDGRWAVVGVENDLWLLDRERGVLERRLTNKVEVDFMPIWSQEGGMITYTSTVQGRWGIYRLDLESSEPADLLVEAKEGQSLWSYDWSPNEENLLYVVDDPETGYDIFVYSATNGESRPFLASALSEHNPSFSADGRSVAYIVQDRGQWEVFVASYPNAARPRKVSTRGGECPQWSSDGERLFFRRGSEIWESKVLGGDPPGFSVPELFVDGVRQFACEWQVDTDGESIVAHAEPREPRMIVVQNWFDELERLVPTK